MNIELETYLYIICLYTFYLCSVNFINFPEKENLLNPRLIFWFLLGMLGIHRFYNGKTGTGILMIITFGGLGIWWLIDGILIIMGKFEKKDGTVISIKVQ